MLQLFSNLPFNSSDKIKLLLSISSKKFPLEIIESKISYVDYFNVVMITFFQSSDILIKRDFSWEWWLLDCMNNEKHFELNFFTAMRKSVYFMDTF